MAVSWPPILRRAETARGGIMRELYARALLWLIRPALRRYTRDVRAQQDWDRRCAERLYRSLGPHGKRGSR